MNSLNITDFYGSIGTFIACLFYFASFHQSHTAKRSVKSTLNPSPLVTKSCCVFCDFLHNFSHFLVSADMTTSLVSFCDSSREFSSCHTSHRSHFRKSIVGAWKHKGEEHRQAKVDIAVDYVLLRCCVCVMLVHAIGLVLLENKKEKNLNDILQFLQSFSHCKM